MTKDLSALEKAAQKALKQEELRKQAEAKERAAQGKLRKLQQAQRVRQATILGESIRDAELSPTERSAIAAVLLRRKDRPRDWDSIASWLPAPSGADFVRVKDDLKVA